MVKYYLSSIKKVLTQMCKILKNDCLLCYSKTLCTAFCFCPDFLPIMWVNVLDKWDNVKNLSNL